MITVSKLFETGEQQRRLSHFAAIVSVAEADGAINEAEKRVLFGLADKLYINEDHFANIVKDPLKYSIERIDTLKDRLMYVYDLFTMIYADSEIDDAEVRFIHFYMVQLGFESTVASRIISSSMELFEEKIEVDKYISLITKKYPNHEQ